MQGWEGALVSRKHCRKRPEEAAHRAVGLLGALETEGGPALAGDVHGLAANIRLGLHRILAACTSAVVSEYTHSYTYVGSRY